MFWSYFISKLSQSKVLVSYGEKGPSGLVSLVVSVSLCYTAVIHQLAYALVLDFPLLPEEQRKFRSLFSLCPQACPPPWRFCHSDLLHCTPAAQLFDLTWSFKIQTTRWKLIICILSTCICVNFPSMPVAFAMTDQPCWISLDAIQFTTQHLLSYSPWKCHSWEESIIQKIHILHPKLQSVYNYLEHFKNPKSSATNSCASVCSKIVLASRFEGLFTCGWLEQHLKV